MYSAKLAVATVAILLLIGISIQILFDPFSSAKHTFEIWKARNELPDAHAKWDRATITDYKFEMRGYVPLACVPSALIEVRNGAVVRVDVRDSLPGGSPPRFLPPDEWAALSFAKQIFPCDYANYTMPQVFDFLGELLVVDSSSILQVDFDPNYGFITYLSFGRFVPKGRLSPRIGDCCSWFSIDNFQVLEE
jgi:hypothetical protein